MTEWGFTVPGQPPSVNHSYAPRGGRIYKVSGVEEYQVGAATITRNARPKGWLPGRRVRVAYRMWLDSPRRDASNCIKALEDAIAAALGVNDAIFIPCVELRETDKANPRVEVTIGNVD